MTSGMQYVFRGEANRGKGIERHRVIFTVTDLTKVVDGVRSVVIWDQDVNQGELVEAEAGVLMRAEPRPRTPSYHQGLAPEVEFNDKAKVQRTGRRSCVPFDCFDDVAVIKEWNPLEPNEGYQLKYHAPGIGTMRVGAVGGKEKEVLVLVDVRQLDVEEMAEARRAALKLESRAYEVSDVYRHTPPLEICDTGGGCSPAG